VNLEELVVHDTVDSAALRARWRLLAPCPPKVTGKRPVLRLRT